MIIIFVNVNNRVSVCLFYNKECSNNTYGLHCILTCGNCRNGQQCHHVTGTCPQRCVQGYHGEKCDTSNSVFLLFAIFNILFDVCFHLCISLKCLYFQD